MNLRSTIIGIFVAMLIYSCSTSTMNKTYSDDNFEKYLMELKDVLTKNEHDRCFHTFLLK